MMQPAPASLPSMPRALRRLLPVLHRLRRLCRLHRLQQRLLWEEAEAEAEGGRG